MPEFTIEIETGAGPSYEEGVLERVSQRLVDDEEILGPAMSLDAESGILGATFQVEAVKVESETELAVQHFTRALAAEGFSGTAVRRVDASISSGAEVPSGSDQARAEA